MDDFIVTVDDLRLLHCTKGLKKWFKAMGLDFALFLKEGITASKLLATEDYMAVHAINKIQELQANGCISRRRGVIGSESQRN